VSVLAMLPGCASMGGAEMTALRTPRTISLACGEQYVWIPFEQNLFLDVPATDCWTTWATIPAEARGVSFQPDGVLDVQLAFADGKSASFTEVAPTRRLPDVERATGVRYRNRQTRVVRVELVLR
jgi:hypothetical protein